MNKKKRLSEFKTSKLSKKGSNGVKGGCTCGTVSSCHIDGTNDADSIK